MQVLTLDQIDAVSAGGAVGSVATDAAAGALVGAGIGFLVGGPVGAVAGAISGGLHAGVISAALQRSASNCNLKKNQLPILGSRFSGNICTNKSKTVE
jgi:osmotically inducible lipoprotein OsmB